MEYFSAMDMRISLRRLEIFCLVVEEDGVTRAANRMFVAQPAVSSQLRALQDSLGVQLFVRRGNHLELTEAGRRAYAWARETLARSSEVGRELDGIAEGSRGSAVVAASMAVGSYLLPDVLTRMRAEREEVEIVLSIAQPGPALRDLEIGHADLAVLGWDEQEVSVELDVEHLCDEPLVLIVSGDHEHSQAALTLAEAAELPHVGVPRGVAFDRLLARQLRNHDVNGLNVVIRLGHGEPIKQAVAERRWAAFMPRYSVGRDLEAGRLRAIAITDASLVEPISIFTRKGKVFSRLQSDVLDAIRDLYPRSDQTDLSSGST